MILDKKITQNIFFDENEKIEPEIDYSFSSIDEPKYHLKGIYENETYTNITDFELENIDAMQAKMEGSQLKKLKYSFMDEKGMLSSIIEYENITIFQTQNEFLSDFTEVEIKLQSEIYNENNQIEKDDKEKDFIGKNISFWISCIKAENVNNVSLINSIDNEEFSRNLFKFFDNFSYVQYNLTENED